MSVSVAVFQELAIKDESIKQVVHMLAELEVLNVSQSVATMSTMWLLQTVHTNNRNVSTAWLTYI